MKYNVGFDCLCRFVSFLSFWLSDNFFFLEKDVWDIMVIVLFFFLMKGIMSIVLDVWCFFINIVMKFVKGVGVVICF